MQGPVVLDRPPPLESATLQSFRDLCERVLGT